MRIAVVAIGMRAPGANSFVEFLESFGSSQVHLSSEHRKRYDFNLETFMNAPREAWKPDRLNGLTAGCVEHRPIYELPDFQFQDAGRSLAAKDMDPAMHLAAFAASQLPSLKDEKSKVLGGIDPKRAAVILGNIILPSETASRWVEKALDQEQSHAMGIEGQRQLLLPSLPAQYTAQILGFQGPAYTLDAACASSLYAFKLACDALLEGEMDLVVAGGLSRPDMLYTQMGFSALAAHARNGACHPLDADSQGLTVGEGAVFFMLLREDEARRRFPGQILGLIRGVGLSNDQRGAILVPDSEGQIRAMEDAKFRAGFGLADLDYVECHATGTALGDEIELTSLLKILPAKLEQSLAIGSGKGQTGHLLTGAGAIGLARVIAGMKKGIYPVTPAWRKFPKKVEEEAAQKLQVVSSPKTWIPRNAVRRAAVNGFGFGGINAQILIEEDQSSLSQGSKQNLNQDWPRFTKKKPQAIALVGLATRFGELNHEQIASLVEQPDLRTLKTLNPDARTLGLPPSTLNKMLKQQLLTLELGREAWAKLASKEKLDKKRAGIFLALGLDIQSCRFYRRWRQLAQNRLPDKARASQVDYEYESLDAEQTLGHLGSVSASRLARHLGFGGPSFTISEELHCGYRAVRLAMDALQRAELDLAFAAAVDLPNSVLTQLAWPAATRQKLVDTGIVWVLKTLDQAQRDGDAILAVLDDSKMQNLFQANHESKLQYGLAQDLALASLELFPSQMQKAEPLQAETLPAHSGKFPNQGMYCQNTEQNSLYSAHAMALKYFSVLQSHLSQISERLLQAGPDDSIKIDQDKVTPSVVNQERSTVKGLTRYRQDRDAAAWINYQGCLELAVGKVGHVLGSAFASVDQLPSRVRLPDEPLLLCHRIMSVEGEAQKLGPGRLVTEHDILSDAWYLDAKCIPTAICVEAGQADLFLSGYLGIDTKTQGERFYRLLNAEVSFHDCLPEAGETIQYDIRILEFFNQGETILFRFEFDGRVGERRILTMRDGVAGFFTPEELGAGKGLVQTSLDLQKQAGKLLGPHLLLKPWEGSLYFGEREVDALRKGDYARAFGESFASLNLDNPGRLPGGLMRLVHRITDMRLDGGRFGLGLIVGEADIAPDDWFLTSHFQDDEVMPGTLMFECCLHTFRVFAMRLGWVGEAHEMLSTPLIGLKSSLKCRGQVLASSKKVTYRVEVKEIGDQPSPYMIADTIMLVDDKPIVEIKNMSLCFPTLSSQRLQEVWQDSQTAPKHIPRTSALYDNDRILDFAIGKPSAAFGDAYKIFDEQRRIARLPGPPYKFLDRIVSVEGAPFEMAAGASCIAEYDVATQDWYFSASGSREMPYAVLLEVALQPCGWLAAYMGSALLMPHDIRFRNLGGNARRHAWINRLELGDGVLRTQVKFTGSSTSMGMIIQNYTFAVYLNQELVFSGDTMFGFFSEESLRNQVGLRVEEDYHLDQARRLELRHLPRGPAWPHTKWRFLDQVSVQEHAGLYGLGMAMGQRRIDPQDWFFKAHFHQDPVVPGSLGLEAMLQTMMTMAAKKFETDAWTSFCPMNIEQKHSWKYRGQIIPTSSEFKVFCHPKLIDSAQGIMIADGYLEVDGRLIYSMQDFSIQRVEY